MFFRVSGVIHLIGYILMMQMFYFKSGYESDSRAQLEFRIIPEIYLF